MKNMHAVQSETVPWTCLISPRFFLGKMCQGGCGIALSLQILVHGGTPELHLFLLAAPGSTGWDCQVLPPAAHKHQLLHYFRTAVTVSPPVLQAPHCSHCRPHGSKLFLLFFTILHSKGEMVFQTRSQTCWKSKEIISIHPKMRFDCEMTSSSSTFSLWSTFLHTVLCTVNLDVAVVH